MCVCVCDKVERLQESTELAGDNAQGGVQEMRLTVHLKDKKSAPTADANETHVHSPGRLPPCSEQKEDRPVTTTATADIDLLLRHGHVKSADLWSMHT